LGIGPQFVTPSTPWIPQYGLDYLLLLLQTFREAQGLGSDAPTEFPLTQPDGVTPAAWASFLQKTLGFEPPQASESLNASFSEFLFQRYGNIDKLNSSYAPSTPYTSFNFELPTTVPAGGPAQRDWYQFAAVVLPAMETAHRFIVLLPKSPGADAAPTEVDPAGQLALAARLIDLYKPAHTTYAVRFYWAAFQIGAARLEHDTAIDAGSGTPQLRVPAQLGGAYAGSSYLGGSRSPVLAPEPTVGRDVTLPE
jgi:hypothetical protein